MSRLPPTKRPPFPASRTHALVYTQAPIFLFIFFFSTKKKQLDSDNLFFSGKKLWILVMKWQLSVGLTTRSSVIEGIKLFFFLSSFLDLEREIINTWGFYTMFCCCCYRTAVVLLLMNNSQLQQRKATETPVFPRWWRHNSWVVTTLISLIAFLLALQSRWQVYKKKKRENLEKKREIRSFPSFKM